MKKFFSLLFIFLIGFSCFALDEKTVFVEDCYTSTSYSDTLVKDSFKIKLIAIGDSQTFWISYDSKYCCVAESALDAFRSAFDKYFEWEKIAIENKAEIDKELPINTKSLFMWFDYNDDLCLGAGDIKFIFFSQNPERHQLIITSNKVEDTLSSDSYYTDTMEFDGFYLSHDQVKQLAADLSEESLNKKLEEFKKQKDVESLFN